MGRGQPPGSRLTPGPSGRQSLAQPPESWLDRCSSGQRARGHLGPKPGHWGFPSFPRNEKVVTAQESAFPKAT